MHVLYHQKAENNECYVVSACAINSVIADFAIIHMARNFPGNIN